MTHSTYQLLLNRGRKAGLTTRELNSALASHPVAGRENAPGQFDANGYISTISETGQRVVTPVTMAAMISSSTTQG
jgi:hypothetical protein